MMASSLMTMLLKFLQLWNRIGCVELYVHWPTNTAGPVCISMLKSLNATNQLKSFKANLFSLTWAQRMPSDTEIKDTLKTLKIYSLSSSRTKTILG